MEKMKVGINGFGRIGNMVFRAAHENLDIVAINGLASVENMAHFLKYDSTHGSFKGEVTTEGSSLVVNGQKILVTGERDPVNIDWSQQGVDLVFECTGIFKTQKDLSKHVSAGAKKVMLSAPSPEVDLTVVYGVNHQEYDPKKHTFLSNASCTTNCLAPVAKVLHEKFGIEKGMMTTVHAYTKDQNLLDGQHKDLRRARAAASSMIPTTTGAAAAVGKVLPALNGKIDGMAIRVPTPNVSVVDFVFETEKAITKDSVNQALTEGSQKDLKGILGVEALPLVSSDFNGDSRSSIVDLPSTLVMGDRMGKVLSWYDNEVGFSCRMMDLALYMQEKGL